MVQECDKGGWGPVGPKAWELAPPPSRATFTLQASHSSSLGLGFFSCKFKRLKYSF